jgi:hypothetical protein
VSSAWPFLSLKRVKLQVKQTIIQAYWIYCRINAHGGEMFLKSKGFQLCLAFSLGVIVLLLPRPEGTRFKITGDVNQEFLQQISQHFTLVSEETDGAKGYVVEAKNPGAKQSTAAFL